MTRQTSVWTLNRVSWLVTVSYALKSAAKIIGGALFASPPLTFDGLHGLLDIFEHGAIRYAGRIARSGSTRKYPIGRRSMIPLINLFIGFGALWVVFDIAGEILQVSMSLLSAAFPALRRLPEILRPETLEELPQEALFAALAGGIMVVCAAISLLVSRVEYDFAHRERYPELANDAAELRNDALLELAIGIALSLVAVLLSLQVLYVELIHQVVMIAALLIILLVVGEFAYQTIRESFSFLLNRAIAPEDRAGLEGIFERDIPMEVRLSRDHEVRAYTVGQTTAFVSATIVIPASYAIETDWIIQRCSDVVRSFFLDRYVGVHTNIAPVLSDPMDDYETLLRAFVVREWGLPESEQLVGLVRSMKSGEVLQFESTASEITPDSNVETTFLRWAAAWMAFYAYGPREGETLERLSALVPYIRVSRPTHRAHIAALLTQSLAVGALPERALDSSTAQIDATELIAVTEKLADGQGNSNLSRAECFFALGVYYQREFSRVGDALAMYRRAESAYLQSGFGREADRLYNSWGHLLSLLYRLSLARTLLAASARIKEERNDRIGLPFSYGCLADNFVRNGQFNLAFDYYDKDIELVSETSQRRVADAVRTKKALACYRQGIVEQRTRRLREAVELSCMVAARNDANTGGDIIRFFAQKEELKCRVAIALIEGNGFDGRGFSWQEIEVTLNALEEFCNANERGPYFNGIVRRLTGRSLALVNNLAKAADLLDEAYDAFHDLDTHNPERNLQLYLCHLESATYHFLQCYEPCLLDEPISELRAFLATEGGYLDEAGIFMKSQLSAVERSCRRKRGRAVLESAIRIIGFFEY